MEGSLGFTTVQIQFVGRWRMGWPGLLALFLYYPPSQRPCPKYPVFGIAGLGWLV